jgi:hypothetical protein
MQQAMGKIMDDPKAFARAKKLAELPVSALTGLRKLILRVGPVDPGETVGLSEDDRAFVESLKLDERN